ncbi:TonB-dependent receptor [Chitinophagaceae bacterium LB-8]|uniref:TonB-dependent receptor n=1 Tax=Paraflavisolibacter caeni TaxID=2982496 RepID=A0A9X2XWA4_9BACT|nr:TonB-dependent receptor [Paraflavisolibacter caeni]MCU7549662.1 TonB-dependent receptor [Paraflavisolibacter caeni]
MMKFTAVFLLALCLNATANGFAQKVSLSEKDVPLDRVFQEIKKQTGYTFVYTDALLRKAKKVTVTINNAPLVQVLDLCFQDQPLTYSILNKIIVVKEKTVIPQKEQVAIPPPPTTITGAITNDKGEPLAGASVLEKGTQNATITKDDGSFTLNVSKPNATLVISFVGYDTKEISLSNKTQISLALQQANRSMADVVVVGYGTKKRANLTGSVATVDAKTFQNRGPLSSPMAALQGQVPGVTVSRSSAQPGRESWSFLIRGNTSVNGSEPLVIVDGLTLPSVSALNSFNPADIDNISFLKDAAASSIYGARAAGGVVIITTKRAKGGKAVIEYNGSVSRKVIGLQPKLVDVSGWGPMMEEARVNDGFTPTDLWYKYAKLAQYAVANNITYLNSADAATALTNLGLQSSGFFTDVKDFVFFPGTMQDVLWDDATSMEHQLSVSSRGDKAGYRISMGYLDDGSLLQVGNNANKRYNLRLNNDYQVSEKLKLESNISLEKNDITQPSNIGAVLNNGIQPGLPLTAQNGRPYVWGSGISNATTNNIADYGGENKELNLRLNTSFNLTYNFARNLRAVGAAGYYFHNTDFRTRENAIGWYDYTGTQLISTLTPSGTGRSFYQRANRKESYYNLNAYLEYSKIFAVDHDFKAMAGAQYERQEFNRFLSRTLDVLEGVPSSLSLSYGDATSKSVAEAQNHYALAGYFSRISYAFRNKYLLELNGRYDGSSKFDADNRWKFFYGFSGGWRITQEEFMKDLDFLNELKLRASWGNVGNQSGIGLYDYIQLLNLNSTTGATNSGFPILGTSPVVRVAPGGLVAHDRTWEKIQTSNLGLDFALLNSRLNGSIEYFIKQNKNMLISRTFPAVLGASAPDGNNGELETKGWDVSLGWRDHIGKLTYHVGGNLSNYNNELVNFGGQKIISSNNRGLNGAVEGYPINSYFGLVYTGRIQSQKELDDYSKFIVGNNVGIPSGASTAQANARLALGDNMFKDVNGDGKITFPEDAVFLGTDDPRLTYSFNTGMEWKGFDFNVIFQGIGKRAIIRDGNWRIPAAIVFQAQNEAFLNKWWTPTRTDGYYPRISSTGTINNYNYFPSDWVVENGAYLRLKNLVIGYTLPRSITKRAHIEKVRFYFSGNDLWETTKIRDGWDPEASRNVSNTGDANNNNQSTYSSRYPFYRNLAFGANITF